MEVLWEVRLEGESQRGMVDRKILPIFLRRQNVETGFLSVLSSNLTKRSL